eukprot:scaffold8471_cov184-Amphora_coffeaeformis.AAC.26
MLKHSQQQQLRQQKENEDQARLILSALHPVVQRLLQVLRDINTLHNAASSVRERRQLQPLFRLLVELLLQYRERLERVLQSTTLPTSDPKLQNMLLEYCLQPCWATYKILTDCNAELATLSSYTINESYLMEQSLCRKVWMESARSLSYLLKRLKGWTVAQLVQVTLSHVTSLPPIRKEATLDSHSEIWEAYVDLLSQVWECTVLSSSLQYELVKTFMDVWPQGALVARVAETFLEASQFSPVTSLKCLKLWIDRVSPQPDLWKRLFPGIFHGLYRTVETALRDFRQEKAALSGLEALTVLCRAVTLEQKPSTKKKNERALLEVMQGWKLSGKSDETKSGESQDTRNDCNVPENLFWTRVAQNLALPLQRLVTQCYNHNSEHIRVESLSLSKEIEQRWQMSLISVLESMEGPAVQSWDKLQDAIMDGTVRLREQSSPVQTYAEQVLQGCSRDRLAGSRLFERWKSMWEDVAGLTSGQQWEEWLNRLQLLQGYLRFLDRRDVRVFLKTDVRVSNLWSLLWTIDLHLLTFHWQDGSANDSRLVLPWKYLNSARLGHIEAFISALALKVGTKSSAVFVDDLMGQCVDKAASSARDVTAMAQVVPLVQVSGLILSTIKCDDTRGSQSVEMLMKSTLPLVISLFNHDTSLLPSDSKAIACLGTCLLQWLSILSRKMQVQSSLRSICLFAILMQYSCSKWAAVKNAAKACLEEFSTKNDNLASNLEELVVAGSVESLLNTALVRLGTDNRAQTLGETIQTSTFCLRLGRAAFKSDDRTRLLVTMSQTKDLLLATTLSFDRWAVFARNDSDMTRVYIDFFETAVSCFNSAMPGVRDVTILQTTALSPPTYDDQWTSLLDEFRVTPQAETEEQDRNRRDDKESEKWKIFATKKDTDLIARVVSIAAYLLSYPELRVQSEACKLLNSCFVLLFTISKLPKPELAEEELNGAKNAILRHIADCWPSLAARTSATVKLLRSNKESTSIAIVPRLVDDKQSPSLNSGEMRIFLSRVLDLVATMVEASDDFMASRVREAVWPWLEQVLFDASRGSLTPSSQILLESALACISRIFCHRPTGVALSGLIPKIGSSVLPLLDSHEKVASLVVQTTESMVQIDSDALLRPLHQLAGQPLEQSPFCRTPFRPKNSSSTAIQPQSRSQAHARNLLVSINSLREQENV